MNDKGVDEDKSSETDKEGLDEAELSEGKNSYKIPVGPINVALHEPLRILFSEDGEEIRDVDIKPGFGHNGIERIVRERNPIQAVPVCQRICGICSHSHGFTFVRAAENALDIETPPRAQYIRVITQELERIHSHLLWAGSAAHEIGFESLFYYIWKEREKSMDALEYLSGNRVNYEMSQIGGVRRDITPDREKHLRESLKYYKNIYNELKETLLTDSTVKVRTQDTGILEREQALELGAEGPTARAAGLEMDIRHNQAYSAYADLDIDPKTPEKVINEPRRDVYARIAVRTQEIKQSIDIIEESLEKMPEGDIAYEENLAKLLTEMNERGGKGIARAEVPRGELFYYFEKEEGEEEIKNLKVRTPTYGNIISLVPMFKGEQIADIPIIAASIDPCMSCMDRVIVTKGEKEKVYTKEDLVKMSQQKTRRIKNG